MGSLTAVFEQSVIDDVLRHAREEFMNEGLEDSLVQELQQLWLSKLAVHRGGSAFVEGDVFAPEDDQSGLYDTYSLPASASSLATMVQRPAPRGVHAANQQDIEYGKPQLYLGQHSQGGAIGAPNAAAGTSAVASSSSSPGMATRGGGAGRPRLGGQYDGPFEAAAAANGGRRLPQLDGQDDEESDTEDVGRDDESLHSDLDDPNDDEGEIETPNHILCLYEKVTRNRNKWRFVLTNGMMHAEGQDYLFQKATGDLEW